MTQWRRSGLPYPAAAVLFAVLSVTVAFAQDNEKWQATLQQAVNARRSGQLEEVEKLLKAAIDEADKFGPLNQRVVVSLDALGSFYYTQGAYAEALPVFTRLLDIREKALGLDHPLVASALSNLAAVENVTDKTAEGEAHAERAVKISERAAADFSGIIAIAAGGNHTCVITANGQVNCWGSNLSGQLGVASPSYTAYPVAVPQMTNAVALAAGREFTCALRADQTVACWGALTSEQSGAMGDASTELSQVPGIQGVQAIAAGGEHACALIEGGMVKCWGSNQRGQLGNGTVVSSPTPVDVIGIKGAKAIATGSNNSCAAQADGGAVCWGTFVTGAEPIVTPVRVPGLSGAVEMLASGSNYGCALLSGGAVSCWWGNKPAASSASARPLLLSSAEGIQGLGSLQSLVAGYAHTCALLTDGSARCWGNNREGQLGNGKTENSLVPVAVHKLAHVTALSAGLAHTCAVLADQTAACWGTDSYGAPAGVTFGLRSHEPVPVGRDETTILTSLNTLANVYGAGGKFDEAERLYRRTLELIEKARGPEDENLAPVLKGYAEMLRKAGRGEDAAKIEARAESILFKPVLTDVPTRPPSSQ